MFNKHLDPSHANHRAQFSFWRLLTGFWTEDRVIKWRNKIFPNPDHPDTGVDVCFNLISLSPSASDVDSPSVPYLTPQLGTGHPCTRTSSVLYFLIRYLDPKVGNEKDLGTKAVISGPIRSKRYYTGNRRRSLTSL